ncbi:MAG: hypothetical protein CME64_01830 [Halobacteriovoraceae bacterium]|nr:hypothetical protein [Halobacteriovoraceae bacterium]|tara:strand:+ start:55172 stop:56347 length:1176 start_codon:yes stop_codon:yes gene_type:complete
MLKNYFSLLFVSFNFLSCGQHLATLEAESLENEVSVLNLTATSAIYEASSNTDDCSYYLIGIKGGWRPTTVVHNNKVYFNIPCKYNDSGSGGWHWGLATWSPGSNVVWHDGDAATGENEIVNINDSDSNGFTVGSVKNTFMVDTGSGVSGISLKWFRSAEYNMSNVPAMFSASAVVSSNGYYPVGFSASSPETLSSADFNVDEDKNFLFSQNDDTWKGKTSHVDLDIFYNSGTYYMYNTTSNAPTNDTDYISIATSTDLISFNMPSSYILKDYKSPHVFKQNGEVYMFAFSNITNKWTLIPGSSLTSFDESKGVAVDLGSEIYGAGNWDDTPDFTSLPGDQPEVAGVEVLNGKVYVFYMAGQFGHVRAPANGTSGAPFDSARGIGVFELKI